MLGLWVFGLCVSLFSTELKVDLCFVNVYGPYVERETFWNNLLDLECLKCAKLILGGDLNYSLGLSEIWGDKARMDSLSDFFSKLMDDFGLMDIDMTILLPTWSNRRVGLDNICKHLDRLLVSVDLLDFELHFG